MTAMEKNGSLLVPVNTPEERRAAARVVAERSIGLDDCRELLDMLGLRDDDRGLAVCPSWPDRPHRCVDRTGCGRGRTSGAANG